ncbi:MAG: universal stress protein [Rhodospirillaceae bacterium]
MTKIPPAPPLAATAGPVRIFLVVVDDSPEFSVALAYACRRAAKVGGRVALLYVMEPIEFQHWRAIEDLMREERRLDGEQILQRHAKEVIRLTGTPPVFHLREGTRREELLNLLDEDRTITVLVLAAGTGPDGPGPLLTHFATSGYSRLRLPLAIIPGTLTEAEIEAVS